MSTAAIPPAAVRTTPVAADQTAPRSAPAPAAPATPAAPAPASAAQLAAEEHQSGITAGGALTAALFVGAGLAIAFCPLLAPFLALAGTCTGIDFMGDVAGFSPVKMLTGRSIGGWIASGFTPRPAEPNRQGAQTAGFNMRRPPETETQRRALPPDDQPTGLRQPEPVPTS